VLKCAKERGKKVGTTQKEGPKGALQLDLRQGPLAEGKAVTGGMAGSKPTVGCSKWLRGVTFWGKVYGRRSPSHGKGGVSKNKG